ncbi:FAD/NAD(P)-binding domain-containing protein [Xylariaceae sp. FL0255]|nr:FAD/NAD(P)-binding domain-containing protein [Xylariaceae sp. FL0255]
MAALTEAKGTPAAEVFDVLIVGAGISGVNCAYRIQSTLPNATFTVLENRDSVGGTWDLFRYPGIRSDSDLFTYSFAFEPWQYETPIAEGPLIKQYMKDCVAKYDLGRHIRFRHKVTNADWSSLTEQWTLTVEHEGQTKYFKANWLILGTGYYDYETPFKAAIPGIENFKGKVIHPQHWPEKYDHSGKRMAVIGSGATAITLVPALSQTAAAVTMVQRSPTYIVGMANGAPKRSWLLRLLPRFIGGLYKRLSYLLSAWISVTWCKNNPLKARKLLLKEAKKILPARVSTSPHFEPTYNPWDQRLCLCPDNDFFMSFHNPSTNVVTGTIESVTEDTINMKDGSKIEKLDAIVTATGLNMRLGGHVAITVNGEKTDFAGRLMWNGCMIEGVPNMIYVFGYTNASWSLGADDTAHVFLRLTKYMKKRGATTAIPRAPKEGVDGRQRLWQLSSTYSLESAGRLPQYGNVGPWRPRTSPPFDWLHARLGDIVTDLHFSA